MAKSNRNNNNNSCVENQVMAWFFSVAFVLIFSLPGISFAAHEGPTIFDFVSATSTTAGAETTVTITVALTRNPPDGDNTHGLVSVDVDIIGGTATGADYSTLFPVTVTFPNNSVSGATQNFSFTIVNDGLIEGDETVVFGLTNPDPGFSIGTTNPTHTLTINDDETPATIEFQAANSATADESAGNFAVTAVLTYGAGTLGNAATADVTDAGGGTAASTTDYSAIGVSPISFPPGSPSGSTTTFNLAVLADGNVEGDETVNLQLGNAGGSAILGGQTTHEATITDDDSASVEFQAGASATINEATGNFSIPLVLNVPLGTTAIPLTVDVTDAGGGGASSGTDYNAVGTTVVTFPPGSTDGAVVNFDLGVIQDVELEGDETVNLQISNPSAFMTLAAQTTHTATITDDETASVAFALPNSNTIDESAANHSVNAVLTLTGGVTLAPISVDVTDAGGGSAGSGSDYSAVGTVTLVFPAGSVNGAVQTFDLAVLADSNVEIDETVNLQLGNLVGAGAIFGAQTTHEVTITDDDSATLDFQLASSATVNEAAGSHAVDVVLSVPGGTIPNDITIQVSDAGTGSADTVGPPADYSAFVPQTLTFPAGSGDGLVRTFNLGVLADTDIEFNESVDLQLINPGGTGAALGTQTTHQVTIFDDDEATVQFLNASSIKLDETAANHSVTLLLNIPGGATPQDISVDVSDVATGTASTVGPPADYTAFGPTTVTFPSGSTNGATQTFDLGVLSDTTIEFNETVDLQLSNVNGQGAVAGAQTVHQVTITDDDQASVQFQVANSLTATESGTHAVNVVLNVPGGGVLAQDITVDVSDAGGGAASSASDYSAIGVATLTFPAGSSNGAVQAFNLNILPDTDVEGIEDVNLQLSNVTGQGGVAGAQLTHRVDISDDDLATVQFELVSSNLTEATASHAVTAILNVPTGTTPGVITVDVSDAGGGSASSGLDYNPVPLTTLTFPVNSPSGTTQTFNLGVLGDAEVENNEQVNLQLSNITGINATLGAQLAHVVTINDNDQATVSFSTATSATVDESAANHIVTLVLNVPSGTIPGNITVDVSDAGGGSAASGSDYAAIAPTTLMFNAGSVNGATQTFNLAVLADGVVEGNETVNLQLSNITGTGAAPGVQTTHVATITEDDFPSDLVISLAVDNPVPTEGATINYTITVTNNGPTNATNVVITDVLPPGVTYVSDNSGGQYDPVTGIWTAGNVNNGATTSIVITVTVDAGTSGSTIDNNISDVSLDQVDTDVTVDDTTESITVQTRVDGDASTVTADPQIVIADGNSTSIITVTALDTSSLPKPNRDISVASSRGVTDTMVQPVAQTDANGVTTATITSATIGEARIIATDVIDSVAFSMQPTVYFSQGELLDIRVSADKTEAVVGDVVNYLVEIRNTTPNDVLQVNIINELPPNFKYVEGSARLNGSVFADPPGNRQVDFDLGTIPGLIDVRSVGRAIGIADPGETGYVSLTYQLVVGAGAEPGNYVNTVRATDVCDACFVSNPGTFGVKVVLDPLFDLGTIIGKVFNDRNLDGRQDEGEPGMPGVIVALDNGIYAITDEHGRYHFPGQKPGQRAIKVDLQSIDGFAASTTHETQIIQITPGLLAKANFGVAYVDNSKTIGRPPQYGLKLEPRQSSRPVELSGSLKSFKVLMNAQLLELADHDIKLGVARIKDVIVIKGNTLKEPVKFTADIDNKLEISSWELRITDGQGRLVRSISGEGDVPRPIKWNAKNMQGKLVDAETIYQYQLNLTYKDGTVANSARRNFGVNKESAVSMNLSGGAFLTGSAVLSDKAERILRKVANTLREYPHEQIVIEGHADTTGTDEVNKALSYKRAVVAMEYLIKKEGISKKRFVVKSFGSERPIADNDTPEGRELNRRIEMKGTVKNSEEIDVIDQPRERPEVRINGRIVNVDALGRFNYTESVKDKNVINFEMRDEQGRSINTSLLLPQVEIIDPEVSAIVGFGDKTENYEVRKPEDVQADAGKILSYTLGGSTLPGNKVMFDGRTVEVDENGKFSARVELQTGKNTFDMVVIDKLSLNRLSRLVLTVKDKGDNGAPVIAVHQIPNMTVSLPPPDTTLINPDLSVSGKTDAGNTITVNGKRVNVGADGSFTTEISLPKGASEIVIKALDSDGYTGVIKHQVNVTDNRLFLIAIADGKIQHLNNKGFLDGAGATEQSDTQFQGRLAYYLRGTIAGKYLIRSAFDTGTGDLDELFTDLDEGESDRLLENIDPDKIYPVYGDNSTLVYDAQSQGKFFLAVESEEFDAIFGNYKLDLKDTELSAYKRTFYGARVAFRTAQSIKEGVPDTALEVFGAEIRQQHVRDELRATGGSLYYLSNRDVVEGSEQVSIVVRDKDTGLTLSRTVQSQGQDYSIKYEQGRVLFNRPISSIISDSSLVNESVLGGHHVFVQVDYEAEIDAFEETAYGARVKQQVHEKISIGATYVNDDVSAGEYELQGIDAQYQLGKNSKITAEVAKSTGVDTIVNTSTDGGLTYTQQALNGVQEGQAAKLGVELDFSELVDEGLALSMGAYIRQIEPGFMSNVNSAAIGSRNSGINFDYKPTANDQLLVRFDSEELVEGTSTPTSTSGNPDEMELLAVQWKRKINKQFSVSTEYKSRNSVSTVNGEIDNSYAAAQLTWNATDKLTAKLKHQQTIDGEENDQTTAGVAYQASEKLALETSVTDGTQGQSAQASASYKVGDGRVYISERIIDARADYSSATVVGGEVPAGENTRVYSEYQWDEVQQQERNISLVGAKTNWDINKGLALSFASEHSVIEATSTTSETKRYTVALGAVFKPFAGIMLKTRNERRRDSSTENTIQFLTTNSVEIKLSPDYTLLGKYRFSKTHETSNNDVRERFKETSVGMAYRPTAHDVFNALARLTHISEFDTDPVDSSVSKDRADVASFEFSWDFNRHFEWVEKEAIRFKQENLGLGLATKTRTLLSIHRLNYHILRDLDLGVEYRSLTQREADDKRAGWLAEVSWRASKNLRFGVGYNFTDFSDNEFSDNDYSVRGAFLRLQAVY